MSVGQVEQVPQSAASPVPPFVTDAVFQHHIVGPDGPQDGMDFLRGPAGINLIHLLSHTHTHTHTQEMDLFRIVWTFHCIFFFFLA